MKKAVSVVISACLMAGLCACGQQAAPAAPAATEVKEEAPAPAEPESEAAVEEETEEAVEEVTEEEVTEEEEAAEAEIEYPTLPLPAYHYTGPEDWAEYGDAVSQFLLENTFGDEGADIGICTPIILKVDDSDPADVKAWGEYWVDQFYLVKTTLSSASGGSFGGIAHFDTTGGSPMLTLMETLDDGESYEESFNKLFVSEGLEEAYTEATSDRDMYRALAISYYVNDNALYITQFQDYGWPPVPIPNAPPTREEDQIIDHVSNLAYTTKFDMRQLCLMEDEEEGDYFDSINDEAWNELMVRIYSWDDTDLDALIETLDVNTAEFEDWPGFKIEKDVTFAGKDGCVSMSMPGPFTDGQRIEGFYLIPRDSDILVVDIGEEYTDDEEKQMATDSIVEALLGNMEVK
ncbi:MAG: hypothetical protein IJT05_05885 [Lachnospiraceae bacterium]|nr:hypothetical protein [Lachnospiraceae bacterium]